MHEDLRHRHGLQADVNMLQTLRDAVYDAIEERASWVSAREMRLLAQWFADTSQALLQTESSRLGSILDSLEDQKADDDAHTVCRA
jgi:hypothetical protein